MCKKYKTIGFLLLLLSLFGLSGSIWLSTLGMGESPTLADSTERVLANRPEMLDWQERGPQLEAPTNGDPFAAEGVLDSPEEVAETNPTTETATETNPAAEAVPEQPAVSNTPAAETPKPETNIKEPETGAEEPTAQSPETEEQPAPEKTPPVTGGMGAVSVSFYPYYDMLSVNERSLYTQILQNVNSFVTTFEPNVKLTRAQTEKVIKAIFMDRPELFWLLPEFEYRYAGDQVVRLTMSYDNALTGNYAKSLFDSKVNAIITEARKRPTTLEQERYVHDALIAGAEYDLGASNNQSAYSALVGGRTVCAGFSRAFQYIMIQLGIPTYYVTGVSSGEDHAWNIVLIDGRYYNVDLTWDNKLGGYKYFNKSDAEFAKDHTRTFLGVGLPGC